MSQEIADAMNEEKMKPFARFHVSKLEYLLASIALISVIFLGYSSITSSSKTIAEATILSNVESPAASIIFTQRETLVYATRLAQWSNGGIPRRDVQIARSLLAQRLAVIDSSGRTMGSRADSDYWRVLKQSDAVVNESPMGVLPEALHLSIGNKVAPLVDEILTESRDLVVEYQRSIDDEMIAKAEATANRDRNNLIAFYIFILFGGLFLLLNVRTNFKIYKRARRIIKEDQAQLEEAHRDLVNAQLTVSELQDLNESKNAFISTVNHELRTPLTSIIGYIEVMQDEKIGAENPKTQDYLEVLDRNAQVLLNLVESMLSLSKIDAAGGELSKERVSLTDAVDNSVFVMQPALKKSGISIVVKEDSDHFVQGDAGLLSQIFLNLVGNAIKFSPPQSIINIDIDSYTHSAGVEYARVRIKDHGIGIPPEDISRLFTRFFRAKNAISQQYPGTGLGLAIVQHAVELHGGEISVSSKMGEGTIFTVEIPEYVSPEFRMIQERRSDVLLRAITAVSGTTSQNIHSVAHEMGGALAFYGFDEESKVLLQYSRGADKDSLPTDEQCNLDRIRLETLLRRTLDRKGGGESE